MSNSEGYSVVTTIFNDTKLMERFLSDITNQSKKPAEIIIADGGSSDDIEKCISEYRKKIDIPIRLMYGNKLNIAEGFNIAIKRSQYEIVMITSVGNRYNPNCFEKLYNKIVFEGYDAAYTAIRASESTPFSVAYGRGILKGEMIMDIPSNHGTMIKKSVVEELGYFCEEFEYAGEDLEFYKRLKLAQKSAICVKDEFVLWDVPTNHKAFVKQVRVYTVGDMQIYRDCRLVKRLITNMVRSFWPLIGIMLLITNNEVLFSFGVAVIMMWIISVLYYSKRYSFWGQLISKERRLLEIYYNITLLRYWKSKNKISMERRLN